MWKVWRAWRRLAGAAPPTAAMSAGVGLRVCNGRCKSVEVWKSADVLWCVLVNMTTPFSHKMQTQYASGSPPLVSSKL